MILSVLTEEIKIKHKSHNANMFYAVIPVFKQYNSYECVTTRQNYKRFC